MSILSKLFGKKKKIQTSVEKAAESANDKSQIRVYDEFGREMFISRNDWRDKVLMGNIKNAWKNPDELYAIIVQSLEDEFFQEIIKAAEHLHKIDPIPTRGAVILGIVYMKNKRIKDAERILTECIEKHGEDGVVLTNLAKVYAEQGDEERSEKTLWHALELDPNQDNGLAWYESIYRERDGKEAGIEAMRRVMALPGSWRAQLWIASEELVSKQLANAIDLYKESMSRAPSPIPADLLIQMSSDLGNNGYIKEIIQLIEPEFDLPLHGLEVGNNLIKAYVELGNTDAAKSIVDKLYSLNRPDWKQHLNFWETEITKTKLKNEEEPDLPIEMSMAAIEGPLWMRDGSPFSDLLSPKDKNAPVIAFFGSTVIKTNPSEKPESQIADPQGRLSRVVPLVLTEKLHLTTNSIGHALIPWINDKGFAVFGNPYTDKDLYSIAEKNEKVPDFIAGITVDISHKTWILNLRLLSVAKTELIKEIKISVDSQNPGPGVENLIDSFQKFILSQPSINAITIPEWYRRPLDYSGSDYLLRLEQLLAVFCHGVDFLKGGGLSGEHEILDGGLQLCLSQPENPTVRMLFVQTLRQMKKVRPDIVPEFEKKIESLQEKNPISGKIGELISKAIQEVMTI